MKNDSRRGRREAERAASAAREAAGLAPGTPLPAQTGKDEAAAPVPAATPASEATRTPAAGTPGAIESGKSPETETPEASGGPEPTAKTTKAEQNPPAAVAAEGTAATPTKRGRGQKPPRRAIGALGSVGVLALGAAALAAGSFFPPATAALEAEVAVTSLPAGDALASCPATMKLFTGAGSGVDPEFAPASKDAKTTLRAAVLSDAAGRVPGAEMLTNDDKVEKTISPRLAADEAEKLSGAGEDGTNQRKGAVGPASGYSEALTVHAQPLGGVQSMVSAVRTYQAGDGDLAGLAVSGCTEPAAESWLTGAVTTPGSTAVLNLVNPSASVAEVRVDLRGADGMIQAPNLSAVAIAPGESKSIILAGYAPNEKSLSAKVTSAGGRISATIQQSTLRGLVPGGVDYLGAAEGANSTQVIPGVALQDPKRAEELAKPGANADAIPELVLAATSAEGATVQVRAFGTNGEVAIPGGGEVVVASNATDRLPLTGLPAGNYTIAVEADSAVSASVKMVRGTKADEPIDLAWAPAAHRLGSEHLMVLPSTGRTSVVLNAPQDTATVSVRSLDAAGKLSQAKEVTLADSKSVVLNAADFPSATALVFSASGAPSYAGAIVTDGAYGVAALVPGAEPSGREGVQVLLRD